MLSHKFGRNVSIKTLGPDPGAQFYAWVWKKHFPEFKRVLTSDLLYSINQELELYAATICPTDDLLEIRFNNQDDLVRFTLEWS